LEFDWKNPDYIAVYQRRLDMLAKLRADPSLISGVRAWYRDHPDDLINDWGMTYDPRNADIGGATKVPFLLFPKQREFVRWTVDRWRGRRRGLAEKSRDMGVSWLSVATAAAIGLTHEAVTVGFGSRDEDSVDKIGDPDSLFWKLRFFLENLPPELTGGWRSKDGSHMRVSIPLTGSVIKGDAGDNIGRGGRAAIYFVDEAASLKRPDQVEAALSQTTNCRIDVSTPRGMANPFAQRRFDAKTAPEDVFTFHWRDDPRKDDAWYAAQVDKLDPVVIAQEIDLSYTASAAGIVIPAAWVQAAVDADKKLGVDFRGINAGALDIADEGADLNAFATTEGMRVEDVEAWSGKGDDIFGTVQRAFSLCDDKSLEKFWYDADGLGAGVRGDARVINDQRKSSKVREIRVEPFRGSGAVYKPEDPIPTAIPQTTEDRRRARKNGDYFLNAKAQGWWNLRIRFQRTFRAVEAGELGQYHPDDLICLNGKMPALSKIIMELSQPTYEETTAGKIQIVKTPKGTKSPNYADAIMIRFAPRKTHFFDVLKSN
jgi:hypothetical protein